MLVAGYVAIFVMGITLGVLGGGGSTLTLPILVYLFGRSASDAVPDSLFLVGLTAAFGAVPYLRRGEVVGSAVGWFGVASIVSVFLTRKWIVPTLPHRIGPLTRDEALLVLFGVVMLGASLSMILPAPDPVGARKPKPLLLVIQGISVGVLAGLVGAGGGFLIVPALVKLAGLPMRNAIASSLGIIALNSMVGFAASPLPGADQWQLLLTLAALSLAGALTGIAVSKRISGQSLRPAFGVFVFLMGVFVLGKELLT